MLLRLICWKVWMIDRTYFRDFVQKLIRECV